MDTTTFHTKIFSLPEPMQQELELYLDYLLFKNKKKSIKNTRNRVV